MLTPDKLLLAYVMLALGALTLVVAHSELRRRRFLPRGSEDRIFRCGKCGFVYTDDPDVDRSRCSQCGTMNEPVTF
jgi:rubrerythrin